MMGALVKVTGLLDFEEMLDGHEEEAARRSSARSPKSSRAT